MTTIKSPIKPTFKSPNIEQYYGPYTSISEAHAILSNEAIGFNIVGYTVGIQQQGSNIIKEYWYQGGTGEENLIEKQQSSDAINVVRTQQQALTIGEKQQVIGNIFDKSYDASIYTGLGKIYLKRNITYLGLPFDEIISTSVSIENDSLLEPPEKIVWNEYDGDCRFFGTIFENNTTKYYSAWPNSEPYTDLEQNSWFYIINGDLKTYYKYNNSSLVEDNETVEANVLTQNMISSINTVYIIQDDFDLNRNVIHIPANCTLKFDGGSLKNGRIVGNNTKIIHNSLSIIFKGVVIDGSWDVTDAYAEWFDFNADGTTNDYLNIRNVLRLGLNAHFAKDAEYFCMNPVGLANSLTLKSNGTLYGNNATIIASKVSTNTFMFSFTELENIAVRNLNFIYTENVHEDAINDLAIFVCNNSLKNVVFENITVKSPYWYGFRYGICFQTLTGYSGTVEFSNVEVIGCDIKSTSPVYGHHLQNFTARNSRFYCPNISAEITGRRRYHAIYMLPVDKGTVSFINCEFESGKDNGQTVQIYQADDDGNASSPYTKGGSKAFFDNCHFICPIDPIAVSLSPICYCDHCVFDGPTTMYYCAYINYVGSDSGVLRGTLNPYCFKNCDFHNVVPSLGEYDGCNFVVDTYTSMFALLKPKLIVKNSTIIGLRYLVRTDNENNSGALFENCNITIEKFGGSGAATLVSVKDGCGVVEFKNCNLSAASDKIAIPYSDSENFTSDAVILTNCKLLTPSHLGSDQIKGMMYDTTYQEDLVDFADNGVLLHGTTAQRPKMPKGNQPTYYFNEDTLTPNFWSGGYWCDAEGNFSIPYSKQVTLDSGKFRWINSNTAYWRETNHVATYIDSIAIRLPAGVTVDVTAVGVLEYHQENPTVEVKAALSYALLDATGTTFIRKGATLSTTAPANPDHAVFTTRTTCILVVNAQNATASPAYGNTNEVQYSLTLYSDREFGADTLEEDDIVAIHLL